MYNHLSHTNNVIDFFIKVFKGTINFKLVACKLSKITLKSTGALILHVLRYGF